MILYNNRSDSRDSSDSSDCSDRSDSSDSSESSDSSDNSDNKNSDKEEKLCWKKLLIQLKLWWRRTKIMKFLILKNIVMRK